MNLVKYYYVAGMCKKDGYREQMPVKYVRTNETSKFMKESMACRHEREGKCEYRDECMIWQEAPETIEKDQEWQLYEKPLGL